MAIKKITGSLRENQQVDPKDLNIVIRKLNEVIDEVNSIKYAHMETNRKVNRNTLKRVQSEKKR